MVDDFKALVNALGLSSSLNEYGEDVLTVESHLAVLGETTLADTIVTGNLQVGFVKVDSVENSLNILGPQCYNPLTGTKDSVLCDIQTLYLQKNLAGNVDFFNGAIVLQPDGNVLVDGSIEVEKYNVDTTNVAGASAGKSMVITGTTGVVINTTAVTDESLIFVTPTTATSKVLSVSSKVSGQSFTVQVVGAATSNIEFNWWIVN